MDDNGDFDLVIDDGTSKMEYESGKPLPPYNCTIGYHDWKWYEGIFERYWFCEKCDKKDRDRKPPKRK